jgi:hypothetical protein
MASVFGSIKQGYTYDPATDPGKVQPYEHDARTVGETEPSRSDARTPGGWQPLDWDLVPVGPQGAGARPQRSHYADPSHLGASPSGAEHHADAALSSPQDSFASVDGVPESLARMGAAGAAHGGVRASGSSEPWANPLGIRLGRRRTPLAWMHAADKGSLHFNRPKVRPVMVSPIQGGRSSMPYPGPTPDATLATSPFDPGVAAHGFGVAQPYLRRILQPYGQGNYPAIEMDPTLVAQDPGPIGGEWAL